MSAHGTNAKSRNVSFRTAVEVKADATQTSFEDRFWPILLQKSAMTGRGDWRELL